MTGQTCKRNKTLRAMLLQENNHLPDCNSDSGITARQEVFIYNVLMFVYPHSYLTVRSVSSHCSFARLLPSFTTPNRVARRPLGLCRHAPPALRPLSTPPIRARTGHTSEHSTPSWPSHSRSGLLTFHSRSMSSPPSACSLLPPPGQKQKRQRSQKYELRIRQWFHPSTSPVYTKQTEGK